MEEKKIKDVVRSGIEAEAEALEKRIEGKEELESLEMPEGSFDDLMKRIEAETTANKKITHLRSHKLLSVALVAIMLMGIGIGATGAKLYVHESENLGKDGELNIIIHNDSEDAQLRDITEEETYEEIEEKLGILALRLLEKPEGMVLEKVFVDENMGEAAMEFRCGEHIFTVYESKRSDSTATNSKPDGVIVGTIELSYLEKNIEVVQIDKSNGDMLYQTQFEEGNAYYSISSDMELEEVENILYGIVFQSM